MGGGGGGQGAALAEGEIFELVGDTAYATMG